MRDILEAALLAEPDDRALSAAYADYLIEEGDPRGELIRLQLLAEDPALSDEDRAELDLEVEELIRVHAEQWLGGLADLLLRGVGQEWQPHSTAYVPRPDWWFERGFLAGIDGIFLNPKGIRLLAAAPETALLRELAVLDLHPGTRFVQEVDWNGQPYSRQVQYLDTTPLDDSPALGNLRRFALGNGLRSADHGSQLLPWVRAMRRIAELELFAARLPTAEMFALRSFDRLTALTVRTTGIIAVAELARNPTTGRLAELTLCSRPTPDPRGIGGRHPAWEPPDGLPREEVEELFAEEAVPSLKRLRLRGSALGDRGVEAMLDARFVRRLTELELSDGCLTDAAADMFAQHRDTAKLSVLNLNHNAISTAALTRLREALPESVTLIADGQRSPDAHVGSPWPEPRRPHPRSRPRR